MRAPSLLRRDEAGYRETCHCRAWVQRLLSTRARRRPPTPWRSSSSFPGVHQLRDADHLGKLDAVRGYKSRRERAPG